MMSAREENPQAHENGPHATATANPGFIEGVEVLWNDLSELTHDQLELISLETQRVGESFVTIVIYGIVISLLVISAWLGVVTALVLWLVQTGLSISLALLGAVLTNILAAVGLVLLIRYESHNLRFSATAESIKDLYNLVVHQRE